LSHCSVALLHGGEIAQNISKKTLIFTIKLIIKQLFQENIYYGLLKYMQFFNFPPHFFTFGVRESSRFLGMLAELKTCKISLDYHIYSPEKLKTIKLQFLKNNKNIPKNLYKKSLKLLKLASYPLYAWQTGQCFKNVQKKHRQITRLIIPYFHVRANVGNGATTL
jgi:hypothetical protein